MKMRFLMRLLQGDYKCVTPKKTKAQEVAETVNEALGGVQSNPCGICPKSGLCDGKRKKFCKVARKIKRVIKTGRKESGGLWKKRN